MGYQKTAFLVVTRLFLLLCLAHALPATHPSFSGTFSERWDPNIDTSLGNTAMTVSGYFERESSEPTNQGAEPIAPSSWIEVKHSRHARAYLAFPKLPSAIRVGGSLALLMLLLLWVPGKQLFGARIKAPAEPEEQEQAEEESAEEQPLPGELSFAIEAGIRSHAVWRLGNLKELLAAAESITSAVGTDEAKVLLRTIKENAAIKEREKQLDTDTLFFAVRNSFGAVRRLHEVAIEHAAQIAKNFKRVDAVSPKLQVSSEEFFFDSVAGKQRERDLLISLKIVSKSLCDDKEQSTRRFHETYAQISTARVFKDEGDRDKLVAAAAGLHRLIAIRTAQERALGIAEAIEEQGLAAVKTLVTGNRMKFCQKTKIERAMASAQLRVAIDRLSKKIGLADERNAALSAGRILREVQISLDSLRAGTMNIMESKSLYEVKRVADEGLEKQQEITKALQVCSEIVADLCLVGGADQRLRLFEIELMSSPACKAHQVVKEEMADLRKQAERLRALCALYGLHKSSDNGFFFSETAIDAVSSEAKEIESRAECFLKKYEDAMNSLKGDLTFSDASINIEILSHSIAGIIEAKKDFQVLETSLKLFEILRDDIEDTTTRAAIATSDAFKLSTSDAEQLQRRWSLLTALYRGATAANSLEEAAKSAVTMRALVKEMERLFEVELPAKETRF